MNKMEEAKAYAFGNRKHSRNRKNHRGTSIYSDFECRGAGAACKLRFFHEVGCSSACGVCFALVFERGIREHCAVQMSTLPDKRLQKPSSSSNIGSNSRRGPPQRAGALDAFAATP